MSPTLWVTQIERTDMEQRMEALPSLADIDDQIIQSKRVLKEQLGIECESTSNTTQEQL